MKRYAIALLAWMLMAASVSAQIIGGGIIGGGGDLVAKLSPTQQLESSSGVYTDAAIQFTATDASRLAMGTNWNPGTKDFAISFWVYLDTSTATQTVLCTGAATNGQDGLCVQINSDGHVVFAMNDSVQAARLTATFTTGIADTTWTQITIYADRSGNAVCYKNGVANAVTLDISTHNASLGATGGNVGSDLTPGNYLNGRLDSLLLFELADMSSVISAMVTALYNSCSGVLATDLSAAQIAAWGGKYGYDLGEASGVRSSAVGWTANDLTPTFAEMVTNGTFTGNATGWNLGANWAYDTNNITATAADADATQALTATVGKLYATSFVVSGSPTGSVRLEFGGVNGTTRATAATHTENIRATAAGTNLAISPVATFSSTVDTVSVKAAEILPAAGIVRGAAADANFAINTGLFNYLSSASNADLQTGDIAFTVGGWCYASSIDAATSPTILSKYTGSGNNREYALFYDNDGAFGGAAGQSFIFRASSNGEYGGLVVVSASTFGAASPGNWYFVVAWHDPTANTLNIQINNGTVDSVSHSAGVYAGAGVFEIGALDGINYPWIGNLDNVFIAKKVLSEAERTFLFNNGEGRQWSELGVAGTDGAALTSSVIKGYWEFEESTLVADSSSNGNTLTKQGTPTRVQGVNYIEGVCSYWESLIATGDAEVETLAQRPSYSTTGDFEYLFADGIDDRLTTAMVPGDAGCAIIVGKGGAAGDVYVGASHGSEAFAIANTGGVITATAGDGSPVLTSDVDPTADWWIVIFSHAGNGGAQFLMINGDVKDTETQSGTLSITETLYLFAENDDGTAADFAEASIARAYYFPQAISQSSAAGITKRIQNALGLSP